MLKFEFVQDKKSKESSRAQLFIMNEPRVLVEIAPKSAPLGAVRALETRFLVPAFVFDMPIDGGFAGVSGVAVRTAERLFRLEEHLFVEALAQILPGHSSQSTGSGFRELKGLDGPRLLVRPLEVTRFLIDF